jgi:hypothetical protein
MRTRRYLSTLMLGSVLCAAVPAVAHAQDSSDYNREPKDVSRAGMEIRLFDLRTPGQSGRESVDLFGPGDRTEVLVTLTGGAPDLLSPILMAEVHEGSCADLEPALATGSKDGSPAYSLTPAAFSLGAFSAMLPVSLAVLRGSAHALAVRSNQDTANATLACVDIV